MITFSSVKIENNTTNKTTNKASINPLRVGQTYPKDSISFGSESASVEYARLCNDYVANFTKEALEHPDTVDINKKLYGQFVDALTVNINHNNKEGIKALLDRGAKPEVAAITSALGAGDTEIIDLLVEHGAQIKPAHFKFIDKKETLEKTIKYLDKHNINSKFFDIESFSMQTLLANFIQKKKSPEMIEVLVNAGANPRIKDLVGPGNFFAPKTALANAERVYKKGTPEREEVIRILKTASKNAW